MNGVVRPQKGACDGDAHDGQPIRVRVMKKGQFFGILAAVCVFPLGCLTWDCTWLAVAPLAGIGVLVSALERDAAGLILNLLLLLLGIGYHVAMQKLEAPPPLTSSLRWFGAM